MTIEFKHVMTNLSNTYFFPSVSCSSSFFSCLRKRQNDRVSPRRRRPPPRRQRQRRQRAKHDGQQKQKIGFGRQDTNKHCLTCTVVIKILPAITATASCRRILLLDSNNFTLLFRRRRISATATFSTTIHQSYRPTMSPIDAVSLSLFF